MTRSLRQAAAIAARIYEQQAETEAREQAARAKVLAERLFGWCADCGEHIDIPNGKLHDAWCPDAPRHMRMPRPDEVGS